MIFIKSGDELERMRRAGRAVARAHELLAGLIKPGVRTSQLDEAVYSFFMKEGVIPSFKGYQGFPASICTSVNEVVVHGIPGDRVLREGDIIGIDIGAMVDGFHGDAAVTYGVGEISPEAQRLLDVTKEALYRGIAQARVGNRVSDISHAVQTYVEGSGFSVVRDFVGHGIGTAMHEAPQIPNFGPPGRGPRLRAGMCLAIEPMVNAGTPDVNVLDDGWTVVTRDARLSAHFEHTVAVTEGEPEILTMMDVL
ncbi:MAG: type I methionyl aminopeptidase [Firmicutes bacterium]|jgi:methionyl aminopeptidase|nr:type I methionyl aminopeptidase [Bacillota bacterium]